MEKAKFDPEKSQLYQHAKRELALAGIDKSDSDYGGGLAVAALELIATFASQGHSGASAEITRQIFVQLASFEILTPLTDNPDEWQSVSKESGYPLWQSKRGPSYFSKDGGKTAYHVSTNKPVKVIHSTPPSEKKKATK